MNKTLTKKDFLLYLAKGGSVNFDKPIYLNRIQRSKLDKDQLAGRKAIMIDGKEGYLNGDEYWIPANQLKK